MHAPNEDTCFYKQLCVFSGVPKYQLKILFRDVQCEGRGVHIFKLTLANESFCETSEYNEIRMVSFAVLKM